MTYVRKVVVFSDFGISCKPSWYFGAFIEECELLTPSLISLKLELHPKEVTEIPPVSMALKEDRDSQAVQKVLAYTAQ